MNAHTHTQTALCSRAAKSKTNTRSADAQKKRTADAASRHNEKEAELMIRVACARNPCDGKRGSGGEKKHTSRIRGRVRKIERDRERARKKSECKVLLQFLRFTRLLSANSTLVFLSRRKYIGHSSHTGLILAASFYCVCVPLSFLS